MNNIKQAIIKLETILENGNAIESGSFVKYSVIKNILSLLEKDQELKIIEMEVELNGVEDSIENAALLEKRLSEAKSLVEDLANTINSLEIKVDGVKIVEDLCFEPIGADPAKTDTDTTNKCVVCLEKADFELENGKFICENCAQIMGELAED